LWFIMLLFFYNFFGFGRGLPPPPPPKLFIVYLAVLSYYTLHYVLSSISHQELLIRLKLLTT
jgi:hypothetical protein